MTNERRFSERSNRPGQKRDHRGNFHRDSRENKKYYDGICSRCGAEVSVPFRPSPDRPLLCRDCLHEARAQGDFDGERRSGSQGEQKTYEITCSHCGKKDTVSFKPYEDSVVLCHECMENPNIERVHGKIWQTVICAVCGKETRVPFRPDPGSRVLCRECHAVEVEEKNRARQYYQKNHPNTKQETRTLCSIEIRCEECGCVDNLPFAPKTNGKILCRKCGEKLFGDDWARRNRVGAKEYPFTCSICGAQDFWPLKPRPGIALKCSRCMNVESLLRKQGAERVDAETIKNYSATSQHKSLDATPLNSRVKIIRRNEADNHSDRQN